MMTLASQLRQGCADLGIALPDSAISAMLEYLRLLEKWNRTYNLTAVEAPSAMVTRHLLDSLSVAPYLHGKRVLDIGTGGGLPGIPLALACPDHEFVLLDSKRKKTRFVNQVVIELGLKNVTVIHARAGAYLPQVLFDTLISRAFASLREMVEQAGHLCASGGVMLAMKGVYPVEEIQALPPGFRIKEIVPLQVPGLEGQRHLVAMTRVVSSLQE